MQHHEERVQAGLAYNTSGEIACCRQKAFSTVTSMQHRLPSEILHNIMSHMSSRDVKALRRTYTALASIGLEHLGTEIPLISHRASFRAISDIAKHPALSRRVTSLFYMCDRLNFDLLPIEKCWADLDHVFESIPKRPTYELQSLLELFQACRNIQEVTVASETGCKRRLKTSQAVLAARRHAVAEEDRYHSWTGIGVRQTLDIANAVVITGTKLRSLTLAGVTHRLWDRHSDEEMSNLGLLVRPLLRLRIFTVARMERDHGFRDGETVEFAVQNNGVVAEDAIVNSCRFRSMLAEAAELRILKLQFWPYRIDVSTHFSDTDSVFINLKDILGGLHFSHLYELAVGWCTTTPGFLREAILRHKATLRRLTLSHIHFSDPDVELFIDSIAGEMPHLRQFTLRGLNDIYHWHNSQDERMDPNNEKRYREDLRHAVESFVLGVGPRPIWDDFLETGWDELRDYNKFKPRSSKKYKYEPLILPEDHAMSDDPKNDYAWDEFNDRMSVVSKKRRVV